MALNTVKICGHGRQIKYLEKLKKRGLPISAFLFSGKDGVGKKTVALNFIAGLFCEEGVLPGVLACGECENCQRLISGAHPDFSILSGEEEIGIDEVRELKRRLSFSSYSGSWRGVLVDDAHRMNEQAQGALLKMVEEPIGKTLFFFVTSMPYLLLETVRSRLLELSFGAVSDGELKSWAENNFVKSKGLGEVFAVANGRPGKVKLFLENPEAFKEEKVRVSKFEPVLKTSLADQFLFSEKLLREDDSEVRNFLQFLIGKARDRVLSGGGGPDAREEVGQMLNHYFQLENTNINRRLIIDSALLSFRNL
ncbi:MAG: hypothetical protein Q7R91_02770 [bacterium]|nr:hypothetical protein [bacterium]